MINGYLDTWRSGDPPRTTLKSPRPTIRLHRNDGAHTDKKFPSGCVKAFTGLVCKSANKSAAIWGWSGIPRVSR